MYKLKRLLRSLWIGTKNFTKKISMKNNKDIDLLPDQPLGEKLIKK
jgi:hypothetical protein